MSDNYASCEGGCSCGYLRYSMHSEPLIVHGCHCTWCQRQTGTAFATNALIEAERVEIISGEVKNITVDTPSGSGQRIARCPKCMVAVWSEYLVMTAGITDLVYFIRVGTLDTPARFPPDVHIHTSTKQPWLELPPSVQAVAEYYDTDTTWSAGSLVRRMALKAIIENSTD
jgi:hypothetical protein